MPSSVVLLSIDDLRFDALAFEDDDRFLAKHGLADMRATPTFDRIAANGTRFARTFSTSSYTPSAHASMLTGFFPPHHHVRAFLTNSLGRSVPTLASMMKTAGFRTIASLDVAPMFNLLGLTQGFDDVIYLDDRLVFEQIRSSNEPIFLFAHFEDVHPPVLESLCPPTEDYNDDFYDELASAMRTFGLVPEATAGDRDAAVADSGRLRRFLEGEGIVAAAELPRYLAGVNKFDQGRFRLFCRSLEDAIDLDDCLLIVTSDHGQGTIPSSRMVDRSIPQKFDHGEALLEELIHVPLIVSGPGIPPGAVASSIVSLVDLVPTILSWCGLPPRDLDGRDLNAALRGEQMEDSIAYAEVWYHDRAELSRYLRAAIEEAKLPSTRYETFLHERTVRRGDLKLVAHGSRLDTDTVSSGRPATSFDRRSLYDVSVDPFEEVDLLVQDAALHGLGRSNGAIEAADSLTEVLLSIDEDRPGPTSEDQPLDADEIIEVEARLRDLGYIE